MKKILLVTLLMCSKLCIGANLIWIGDFRYAFQGNSAAVVSGYDYNDNYANSQYANYSNESYSIPSEVIYDGKTYVVDKVGFRCFDDGNIYHPNSKKIKKITLPETIKAIGRGAFSGTNISSLIIPKTVESFANGGSFGENDFLAVLIYTSSNAPLNWTATTITYVPDKVAYSNPAYRINGATIVEMISFSDTEFEYTGQTPTTTWTNNVEGYTASLSMPAISGEVGSHEEWIPVTFTKGDESFTANVVYRYTIKPAKLTAKVNNVSREYGDENPQFSISYTGFISGENESVITTQPAASTTATKTSNVGEYPITISGGSVANYELIYEPGVLTVTKASLSAKVNDAAKVYGSQNPAFTIEYYGLKNEETAPAWTTRPTFQTEATQSSGVGQYEVKAFNGVPVNYDLGEITAGTLNITPAPLTIKANDATRQYYNDEPNFSYTCNGFVNGDNESVFSSAPVLSTSATKTSSVGAYPISVSEVSSLNYSISLVNGTLTITPRTLTASVGNYERAYNEENPAFEVTYNGFVGNEDESVLNEKPMASTTATKTSDVGTYPITVSGGDADNYTFSYTSGTLTINKAEQEITWEQDFDSENVQVGDQVELQAYATSGLPINYVLSDNDIASLYTANGKVYLDCLQEGKLVIRALQNGNNNYYAAVRKSKTLNIGESSGIETVSIDAMSSDAPVYDLMGNRVKMLIKGRIYIQNGKKLVVK